MDNSNLEDFDRYFPSLTKAMETIETVIDIEALRSEYESKKSEENSKREVMEKFYDLERDHILPQINEQLQKNLHGYWEGLETYNWGYINIHTLNVVYRTVKDPLFLDMSRDKG